MPEPKKDLSDLTPVELFDKIEVQQSIVMEARAKLRVMLGHAVMRELITPDRALMKYEGH